MIPIRLRGFGAGEGIGLKEEASLNPPSADGREIRKEREDKKKQKMNWISIIRNPSSGSNRWTGKKKTESVKQK